MTVSPHRPDDDSRHFDGSRSGSPSASRRGSEADSESAPRLFQLPDLHPQVAAPDESAQSHSSPAFFSGADRGPESTVAFDGAAERTAAASTAPSGSSVVREETAYDAKSASSPFALHANEPHANEPRSSHRAEPASETRVLRHQEVEPAGRSWMETVATHRKVLVMLLIAVAAAIWTGRGGDDANPTDSSIADSSGTLEFDPTQFDAGEIVDGNLELSDSINSTPPAVAGSEVGSPVDHVALAEPVTNANAVASAGVQPQTDLSSEMASAQLHPPKPSDRSNNLNQSGSASGKADQSVAKVDSANADHSIARANLDGSSNTFSAASFGGGPTDDSAVSSDGRSNGVARSDSVQEMKVTATSSRTPNPPKIEAPTLEELEQAKLAGSGDARGQSAETYLQTNTPAGVDNWLRYLPPVTAAR